MTKAIVLYEELVDIVDSLDRVRDIQSRSLARALRARTRTALVLLFNNNGDIMTTIVGEGKSQEGKLYLVSETPQAGETPENAAYRGLYEELGIPWHATHLIEHQSKEKPYWLEFKESGGRIRNVHIFSGNWQGSIVPSPENHATKFIPPETLDGIVMLGRGLVVSELAAAAWDHYKNQHNGAY
jgi:8-oxo-dGTP pyrophosphatase MutT (NUDIX family)